MKRWFVYLIAENQIGTWANNSDEAEKNLRDKYGDAGVTMGILELDCTSYMRKPKVYTNGTDFVKADYFAIKDLDGDWREISIVPIDEYVR